MNISQLIARLEEIRAEHGELNSFDAKGYELDVAEIEVITDNSVCDPTWNMPKTFISIGSLYD